MADIHRAILWRWPGARFVTSGNTVVQWDGPMARPTNADITQAMADYDAQNVDVTAARDRDVDTKLARALAAAIHKRFKAVVPTDPTTAAQWRAAILAEYDALQ